MYRNGVTIAIPNWNHEFFLPASIASAFGAIGALRARGVPGEVLVIDDASRDGSPALLRALEAQYGPEALRVRRLPRNSGLAAARNTGLLEARYRYVVFMDADNRILGENLPLFHRAIVETEAAGVYGNLLVHECGRERPRHLFSNESIQPKIFDLNYIDAFALFDRTQLFDIGGYDDALAAHEDWELWLHLATNGRKLVFVPLAFGRYYELPHSMIQVQTQPEDVPRRCTRMFNQAGFRKLCPTRTNLARYFPGVGYL